MLARLFHFLLQSLAQFEIKIVVGRKRAQFSLFTADDIFTFVFGQFIRRFWIEALLLFLFLELVYGHFGGFSQLIVPRDVWIVLQLIDLIDFAEDHFVD